MAARWKELYMDTTGGDRLGRFWAGTLGLRFQPADDDPAGGDVVGDAEAEGIAMCQVPEAKTVKHRVHIDVYTDSVASLVDRGARVLLPARQSGSPWTVMADPEGGEFCAFERAPEQLPGYRFCCLVVDAADAASIAQWWARAFGTQAHEGPGPGWWAVPEVPGAPFEGFLFIPVPEPKTVKNRIHWDVLARVSEMEALGATVLRPRDSEIAWTVMADPEGNEFCVFER